MQGNSAGGRQWPAVIMTDAAGTVVHWDDGAESLYGWNATEALGRPILELNIQPEDVDTAAAIMRQLGSGQPWEGAFPVRHKNGGTIVALVRNIPRLDRDGQVVGVIGQSWPIDPRQGTEALDHDAVVVDRWGLRPREQQVLELLMEGRTNRDIARKLILGEETVKTYLRSLYRKLGARDRFSAVAIALGRRPDSDVSASTAIPSTATQTRTQVPVGGVRDRSRTEAASLGRPRTTFAVVGARAVAEPAADV